MVTIDLMVTQSKSRLFISFQGTIVSFVFPINRSQYLQITFIRYVSNNILSPKILYVSTLQILHLILDLKIHFL